jgi:hypothetical protein
VAHQKNQRNTNGHAGPRNRSNANGAPDRVGVTGHASDSTARDAIPVHRDRAASDDAGGLLVAGTTPSVVAGANPDAYADAAPAEAHGSRSRKTGTALRSPRGTNGANTRASSIKDDRSREHPPLGPTDVPLPPDPGSFVDEIHHQVDLFQQWINLLKSKDGKVRQRAVERLTDMKYKGAAPADDEPRIVFDLPRPTGSSVEIED